MEPIIFLIFSNWDLLQFLFIIQEDILLVLAFGFWGLPMHYLDFCPTLIDYNLVNFHSNWVVLLTKYILRSFLTSFLLIKKSNFEWKLIYFGKTLQVIFSSYWFWAKLKNIVNPSMFGQMRWFFLKHQSHNHCEHFISTHPRPILSRKEWMKSIHHISFCQLHCPITFSFLTQISCLFLLWYYLSIIYNFHSLYKIQNA